MYEGKLSNGFEYKVDGSVLDDMYLVEAIEQAQDDDPIKVTKVIRMILGEEQKDRFFKSCEKDGRAPVTETMAMFTELMESLGDEGKK